MSYKIMLEFHNGPCRRYNTKTFSSYQEAKKHVRRLVTKLFGKYSDTYSQYGFTIVRLPGS